MSGLDVKSRMRSDHDIDSFDEWQQECTGCSQALLVGSWTFARIPYSVFAENAGIYSSSCTYVLLISVCALLLHCIVLSCIVLLVLHCIVWCCIVLYCIVICGC